MTIVKRLVRAGFTCVVGMILGLAEMRRGEAAFYIDTTHVENDCSSAGGTFALLETNPSGWGYVVVPPFGDASNASAYVCYFCPTYPCSPSFGSNITPVMRVFYDADPPQPISQTYKVNQEAKQCGSIIGVDSRTVSEVIPIVGAPFSLVYNSAKVRGNKSSLTTIIPTSHSLGAPSSLISSVEVTVEVSGLSPVTSSHTPSTGSTMTFTWDGNDAFGVPVDNPRPVNVTIAHTLTTPKKYVSRVKYAPSQGLLGPLVLGKIAVEQFGMGGWLPSIFFYSDDDRQQILWGDGRVQSKLQDFLFQNPYLTFHSSTNTPNEMKGPLLGNTIYSYGYTSGKLTSITDGYGNQTTFQYTGGKLSSITAPFGQVTTITTDANGYINSVTNPNGETFSMTYSSDGLLLTFEKPGGAVSTMTYDSVGNLVSDENSEGPSTTLSRTDLSQTSHKIAEISDLGFVTEHTVTNSGTAYTRQEKRPGNIVRTHTETIASHHGPSSSSFTDFTGYSTSVSYNNSVASARFLSTINELGAGNYRTVSTSRSAYCMVPPCTQSGGYTISKTINGKTTTIKYDGQNQKITTTTPLSRTYVEDLDSNERVISSQVASFTPVTYDYDSYGRLEEITQGARETTFTYNSTSGFLETITNALNQTTEFEYDPAGRVAKQILPDSREIEFDYDPDGNLSEVVTPSGSVHTLTYNGYGLLTSYVAPVAKKLGLEKAWRSVTRSFRKLASKLGLKTLTTSYTYDNDRRLIEIERPSGDSIIPTYDSTSGLLTGHTLPVGANTFGYNGDFPASSTSADSMSTGLSWSGHLLNYVTTAEGGASRNSKVSYSYNGWHFVSSETVTSNGTTSGTAISYTYNNDALLTGAGAETLTRTNSTGLVSETAIGSDMKQFFSYSNDFGELSQIQAKYSTTVKYQEDVIRDDLGRIVEMSEDYGSGSDTYEYTFDSAGRLTQVEKNSATIATFTYDDNSNRVSQTVNSVTTNATYDDQDRLLTFGDYEFTYNDNGEMLTKENTSNSETTTYTYDVFGNLKSVAVSGGPTVIYKTDAKGRRITKSNNGSFQVYYVYDQFDRVVALLNSSGQITARFVYGLKTHVPDYAVISGTTYQLVHNHLGSPVQVIDTSTGTVTQQIEYDVWGNVTSDTNPGFQPFGFAGGLYDPDTKLTHFGAREYDASVGRWLTKDPILFGGHDTNLYGYSFNDPVNFIDPNGLDATWFQFGSHAVLGITDPTSSSGVRYVDFGPSEGSGIGLTSPTSGTVSFSTNYPLPLVPLKTFKTSPTQDLQMLQRARSIADLASKGQYQYSVIPPFAGILSGEDGNNCIGFANQVCGGACK